MPNMSYCRFENTLADLRDCYDHMDEEVRSESEIKSKAWLIKLCQDITENYGADA